MLVVFLFFGGGDKLGVWNYQIHTTVYKMGK